MKLFSTLLITAAIFIQMGCGSKNVQFAQDRLLVGEWLLTDLKHGDETISEITYELIYQFTADKQLVIKSKDKREAAKYVFSNNLLIVDDGNITKIKEKIKIEKLDKTELILAFKMDGKDARMTFKRQSKVLK